MFKKKEKISTRKFEIASLIATYLNIGNIKWCPGTFGSLATFPLFFAVNFMIMRFEVNSFVKVLLIYFLIMVFLFLIAFWSVNIYIKTNKKNDDPKEVVIDEVIGQMIAFMIPNLLLLYYSAYSGRLLIFSNSMSAILAFVVIILPIVFFRLFDILKPGLVGYFDQKVKGAKGIIMDDVIAGIYASFMVCILLVVLLY